MSLEIIILIIIGTSILFYYKNNFDKSKEKIKKLENKLSNKELEINELRNKSKYTNNENEDEKKREDIAIKYEKFVKGIYEKQGYTVEQRGIITDNDKEILNKKDGGIDLIARKYGCKTILIQCKYWTSNCKKELEKLRENRKDSELKERDLKGYFIEHKTIQEFLGNCTKYLFSNNDIQNIDNYDFILVVPTFNNLKYNAKHELQDVNQKVKLRAINMIEDYQLELGILEIEVECYSKQCKYDNKKTPVILIYSYKDNIFNFECQNLDDNLLKKIQEKYPKFNYTTRKKDNFRYIANNCINCGTIHDDSFLINHKDNLEIKHFIALNKVTNKFEYISELF